MRLALALVALVPALAHADARDATAAATVRAACKDDSSAVQRVPVAVPALDWKNGALVADLGRSIAFENGSVELYRNDDDPGLAPAPMPAEQGAAFVRARSRDKLAAVLAFELASGALVEAPCLSLAGGRILHARYRPVRLELYDLSSEAGRSGRRPALVLRPPGAVDDRAAPRVQLGPVAMPRPSDEPQRATVERALAEAEPGLRRCYAEALQQRPELVGRVVLGVALDRGRLTVARVEIDSLGDAALLRCARAAVEGLRAPSGLRASGFSLPIAFDRR